MRARATSLCAVSGNIYIIIINNGTSYKNVESFVPNVKQVLFLNGSVVLLFCCFLKTCFSRKRLDALTMTDLHLPAASTGAASEQAAHSPRTPAHVYTAVMLACMNCMLAVDATTYTGCTAVQYSCYNTCHIYSCTAVVLLFHFFSFSSADRCRLHGR